MEINNKTRRQLRFQAWTFIILFLAIIGLIGWLSNRYNASFDWTATGNNSLSKASVAVLSKLKGPVTITSYASGGEHGPIRSHIRALIRRYKKYSSKIHFHFIDPMKNPDLTRKLGIRTDGEMIVKYQGRSEDVNLFTESSLTNSLERLLRNAERKIVFITGHGERNPLGHANFDLGNFFHDEEHKGFKVTTVNLTQSLAIPANTSVLVIASPLLNYLPGEVKIIKQYLAKGGNLWWMQEPKSPATLKGLADALHISFMNGEIVDLEIRMLGVNDPTIVMGQYLPSAITNNFKVLTLFPQVTGINYQAKGGWTDTPFLESVSRSWLETGPLKGAIQYNPGQDVKGPVKFGVALTRTIYPKDKSKAKDKQHHTAAKPIYQRVVVMGDGDFMSNAYLGNQGNQQLASNILNWLTNDNTFINIPEPSAPGSHLVVNKNTMITLGTLYLIVIPLLLIAAGVFIWLRRRKR